MLEGNLSLVDQLGGMQLVRLLLLIWFDLIENNTNAREANGVILPWKSFVKSCLPWHILFLLFYLQY
jgi:hypothetical protein